MDGTPAMLHRGSREEAGSWLASQVFPPGSSQVVGRPYLRVLSVVLSCSQCMIAGRQTEGRLAGTYMYSSIPTLRRHPMVGRWGRQEKHQRQHSLSKKSIGDWLAALPRQFSPVASAAFHLLPWYSHQPARLPTPRVASSGGIITLYYRKWFCCDTGTAERSFRTHCQPSA